MNEGLTGVAGLSWTTCFWSGLLVLGFFLTATYLSSAGDALMLVSLSFGLGFCLFGSFIGLWFERLGLAILAAVFFYIGFIKRERMCFRSQAQAGFFVVLCLLLLTFRAGWHNGTVKAEFEIRSDGG